MEFILNLHVSDNKLFLQPRSNFTMTDYRKITGMPPAGTLTGNEWIEVVQGGINKKAKNWCCCWWWIRNWSCW